MSSLHESVLLYDNHFNKENKKEITTKFLLSTLFMFIYLLDISFMRHSEKCYKFRTCIYDLDQIYFNMQDL